MSKALEGVEGAAEILPRLLAIYRVTASGWDEGDAYFLVKNPMPLAREKGERLASTHLRKFVAIAKEVAATDLLRLLEPLPSIEVVEGQTPWPPSQDDPETLFYEARADFMASLTPLPSDALLLDGAIYYLACDYFLRDHVLWPLYRQSAAVAEPFESYFELWTFGAGMRFVNDRLVKVFVPAPIG